METDRQTTTATEGSVAEVPSDPTSTVHFRPSAMMALVLNLLAMPLGHVYVGALRRGCYLWIARLALGMIAVALVLLIPGRPGLIGGGIILLAAFVGPLIDCVRLALSDRWRERSKPRPGWHAYAIVLVLALVASTAWTALLRGGMIQAFRIPSLSMAPTLVVGDFFFVNKTPRARARLRRCDIVVFQYPLQPDKDFVMRIVGLPNEVIEIKAKQVFVNGAPLDEPYAVYDADVRPPDDPRDHVGPWRIPRNEFFLMGDNRDNSNDSRYWGSLPARLIRGHAHVIYWSWDAARSKVRWERIGSRP